VEILNRTKSGRLVWMETSISPTFDEAGALQLWVAVERDITLAKEREAELARARLAAEEAGQSKSRFLANMSHEIRTPMNGVIGVADLLSETQMTPVQVGYVGTILESGRALLGIINDILDLAKLQSGKSVLEQVPFSPVACIESVMRVLGPEARKRGLDLDFAGDRGEGLVIGDEGKLRQIIMNLVGNAVKFTQGGAVSLRLKLPRSEEDLMEIAVTDTGIGIAPDRIQAIFDSFSQADDGISRQFGGTGLGLTICSMLAHEMGGSIDVQSELGRGSTFTLRAHLLPASGPLELPAPKDRRKFARLRQGLTVMVAEDNRTNMMIVRKMLQTAVPHLIAAENGEEAVRLYRERPPDLILMDVSMPVKDGLQATRDIRALEAEHGLPHCPIVALTANAFGEDREACRVAGFDGFLVKPVSRVDLMAAIAAHFPERQTQTARKIGL
jgi:signal transduction histidine kinase/CheY-like chemotaxis protein